MLSLQDRIEEIIPPDFTGPQWILAIEDPCSLPFNVLKFPLAIRWSRLGLDGEVYDVTVGIVGVDKR